ncbi:hypothetical protein EDB82DRAFT_535863 [Fusarium venenatum]|uniref:uncharacterized protein n=1 Tax=Fusarium venenatum TaxID=56646 RepID=UPI001D2F94F8|nr:hypothetical protein EDB82DRAFT_535863 [Fusarium venenatum]
MSDPFRPSEMAIRLQKYHRRCELLFVDTPTPRDDVFEVNRRNAEAWHRKTDEMWLASLKNEDVFSSQARKKVSDHVKENLAQIVYRNEDEQRKGLGKKAENALKEHLDILGPVARRVCTNWLSDQEAPPTPMQDRVEDEALSANSITESRSPILPCSLDKSIIVASTVTAPSFVVDEPDQSLVVTNEHQDVIRHVEPAEPSASTPSTQNNRRPRSLDTEPLQPNKSKRRFVSDVPLTDKTITLYQVENGPKDYVIEHFGGIPYVLECAEHGKEFHVRGAINSAQTHLRTPEHYDTANNPDISLTWDKVIAKLGKRVLYCTLYDAKRNNAFVLGKQNVRNGQSTRTRSSLTAIADDNTDAAPNSSRTRSVTRLRQYNARPIEGPVGNSVNIADGTSANETSKVFYNRTAGTDYASPEERRSLITAGKQAIRRPVAVAPDVRFPACDGLPRYEEPYRPSDNGPDLDHHGDHMEVDCRTINDSADSSDSTGYYLPFVRSTFQLGSTNYDSHLHREVEDLSMSDGAQAGPSSRSAVVKSEERSKARVQARNAAEVAYSRILADPPSAATSDLG